MEELSNDSCYLELNSNPVRFESVSQVTNVFFDDCNRQVFTVRSGGVTGVSVIGPSKQTTTKFRMEDKGPVISIKFSPDQQILAIQRTKTSVEFVNFSQGQPDSSGEYSQSCRTKAAIILGFVWTSSNEVLLVTDHGIELYQLISEKKNLKFLKNINLQINWFVFCPISCLIVLSTSTLGNQLQPVHIKSGSLNKLVKFEVDLPVVPKPAKLCLLERDVSLAVLYGQPCIIVLRHQPRGLVVGPGTEVLVYTIHKMSQAQKSHILRLDLAGRFAISVVDNLIVVHHQASKTSLLFDIRASPSETLGYVSYHSSVAPPRSIRPCEQPASQLYSPNWVVFQPNIIIDAKLGCLWYVELRLLPLTTIVEDKTALVDMLMRRKNAKPIILQLLQNITEPISKGGLPVANVGQVLDAINDIYRTFLEATAAAAAAAASSAPSTRPTPPSPNVVLVDQADLYTNVLSRLADSDAKRASCVLLEYLRSLAERRIPVQHYLHELLINALVRLGKFYQLHQLLQYHVVSDSKPLACLLLSLENLYPAASQLALDMLGRLSTAADAEVLEVLLSKGQVLPALRHVRSSGCGDRVSSRKLLEAAQAINDPTIFYAVFKHLEQRNLRLRGTTEFSKGEHCESFVEYFRGLFADCNSNA